MMNQLSCGNFFRSQKPSAWSPAINVYESDDRFVLCADLAGMTKEGIQVSVEDRQLIITGERGKPALPGVSEPVGVLLLEIDWGRFRRAVSLPDDVDVPRIVAHYREGFLFVMLPRLKPAHSTGGGG